MNAETFDPNDWWDEVALSKEEAFLMGRGESTPGLGGPYNRTSVCYLDGRVLTVETGAFSHGCVAPEDIPEESYASTRDLHWDKDYCLEHFTIEGGER